MGAQGRESRQLKSAAAEKGAEKGHPVLCPLPVKWACRLNSVLQPRVEFEDTEEVKFNRSLCSNLFGSFSHIH